VVWAYVTITGDETGEKLLPITKKVSLYRFTAPPSTADGTTPSTDTDTGDTDGGGG
jgi:hypothetical protein